MTGCGFKNNLFKSLLEKYYFIAHGGDFAGCLLLFTRRYCVRLRKGTGAGRSCCLSSCQAGRNGAAFLRPFTVLRKKRPGAVQLFNSVARTVLAFSRLFDDPGLGDFYGWLYFHC